MNLFLGGILFLLSSCLQHDQPVNRVVLKGSLETKTSTHTESISDLKREYPKYKQKYQSVRINFSTGNPMRDALSAFL